MLETIETLQQGLLAHGYLAERARLIDPKRAQDFGAGNPVKGGTIYLTAADERGMMVSFIQSNYMGFGSGVVVPGWGIALLCLALAAVGDSYAWIGSGVKPDVKL